MCAQKLTVSQFILARGDGNFSYVNHSFVKRIDSDKNDSKLLQHGSNRPHRHCRKYRFIVFARWRQFAPYLIMVTMARANLHLSNGISIGSPFLRGWLAVMSSRQTDHASSPHLPYHCCCNAG